MLEFAPGVYVLCLLTSVTCGWLLVRSYNRYRTPMLLWSAACFVFLALNNLLVVIDMVFLPSSISLLELRALSSLAGVTALLYGFIWELD